MQRGTVTWVMCAVVCANSLQESCYDDNVDPYLLMSSKTAYEFVHDNNSTTIKYPGCTARQFWILARHGTRYPSQKGIKRMVQTGPKLQALVLNNTETSLCPADVNNLRHWQPPPITKKDDEKLTTQGSLDLCFIARRFKQRFQHLLGVNYDKHKFVFRTTNSQRTKKSLKAIAKCLFGTKDVKIPDPLDPDDLIETYKACPAYLDSKDANECESKAFLNSSYVTDVVSNVSYRLGFRNASLTNEDVDLIYDLCRYEKAWNPPLLSPWCAAFSTEDLKVLEYVEDLKYYYTEGYGDSLNVAIGCPPIYDMLNKFMDVEQGLPSPLGIFYFSHSTMLNMVLSRLGLYKDTIPLTSDNFPEMSDRQWRSSLRGSFATNVAAVLYECDKGEKWQFQLFVDEKPVQLEGCPPEGLCSWQTVKVLFQDIRECPSVVKQNC